MLLATFALWRRDVVRFYRQRSRVIGALGTPVVFWVLLGSGLGSSFRAGSADGPVGGYLEYFYPGTLALILLFTAIFSTISVIEDRHEGFLQGVLVAPVPRAAIALGKILGGTTLALMQAGVFLLLAPLANISIGWASLPLLAVVLGTLAFRADRPRVHAGMDAPLHPRLPCHHEPVPVSDVAALRRGLSAHRRGGMDPGWVMLINPMTYGVSAIRGVLAGGDMVGATAAVGDSLMFIVLFGAITLVISTAGVHYRRV